MCAPTALTQAETVPRDRGARYSSVPHRMKSLDQTVALVRQGREENEPAGPCRNGEYEAMSTPG